MWWFSWPSKKIPGSLILVWLCHLMIFLEVWRDENRRYLNIYFYLSYPCNHLVTSQEYFGTPLLAVALRYGSTTLVCPMWCFIVFFWTLCCGIKGAILFWYTEKRSNSVIVPRCSIYTMTTFILNLIYYISLSSAPALSSSLLFFSRSQCQCRQRRWQSSACSCQTGQCRSGVSVTGLWSWCKHQRQ